MGEMVLKQYVVDAFTDRVFSGNPAAVCILERWLSDPVMQDITKENNLSETAFAVKYGDAYQLRWFTPGGEIDLCGHATLACAYVLMNYEEMGQEKVTFSTRSGELTVTRRDDLYEMDFPGYDLKQIPVTSELISAIGAEPAEAYIGRDLLCVFDKASTVRNLNPNMEALKQLDGLLLQATAPGDDSSFDCISRSFAPKLNVPEDPVCGSGHCHIIPYWSRKTGKSEWTACQASPRGGVLFCRTDGERVVIAGKAALYSRAEIHIPSDDVEG